MNPHQYINQIRNDRKRQYATKYLEWLLTGEEADKEPRPIMIGTMAAQAVRLQLRELLP